MTGVGGNQIIVDMQGFLSAALSFATDKRQKFLPVLVIVGIVSSVSEKSKHYKGPPVIGYAFEHPGYRFVLPWFILPLLFAATWVAVYFEK